MLKLLFKHQKPNTKQHTMTISCTGVILSGGLNTRFDGVNKALVSVGGRLIIDRLLEVFSDIFDDIILVTNHPEQFLKWDIMIVTDVIDLRSSLTGIHTGLFYASNPYAFFSACDTPFLKKELVEILLENVEPKIDIVMPETAAGFEPLCAVYSKRCLMPAEDHLKANKLKIQWALRSSRIKHIAENQLRQVDPELRSFFNINTPEDLARAEAMVAQSKLNS
jgi:molybdopterin-guanine dinucleotide biosynthesis protein A